MKVFDAGEIHSIKGFKIECRKVLTRDNLRTQTVVSGPASNAKAKLARADEPHLKAVNRLMDDQNDLDSDLMTRPRGSELNASALEMYSNMTGGDPKASIMDTTTASAKQPKKNLKYSGQVFQFPNDETLDMTGKPNDTLMQETSFLDRSQVPVRADPESMHYGNILNDDEFGYLQDQYLNGPLKLSEMSAHELKPNIDLLSFGKQNHEKKVSVRQVTTTIDEDEDALPWHRSEFAMGPIDTKALEAAMQKLSISSQKANKDQ